MHYLRDKLENGLPVEMVAGRHRCWDVADPCGLHKIRVEYPQWSSVLEPMYDQSMSLHDSLDMST